MLEGFQSHDRGQLVMACGSGKTLTALWIAEALKSRLTIVFLPSISLLEQFASSWRDNAQQHYDILCVCSDESVVRGSEESDDISAETLRLGGLSVTTDCDEVGRFLSRVGPRLVFSTYHSAGVVAAAQAATTATPFDLMVCDEAHRCAGPFDSPFAVVLDDRRIKAVKRLYATATPRVRGGSEKPSSAVRTIDMTNEAVFGPRFHTLSFRRAIDMGLLCDYQIVVVLSDSDDLRSVLIEGGKTKPASETDRLLDAGLIGVVKALDEFNLRKVITFHHSLSKASRFQRDIGTVADTMRSIGKTSVKVRASFVSGKMKADVRRTLLSQLALAPDSEHRVITNARCLTEGIDVPSVDGIVFVDPRTSEIDIAQALGRVLRVSPGKSIGTVVLPILVGKGESPDEVAESTQFRTIWHVLAALREHDEEFGAALDRARAASMAGSTASDFDPLGKVRFIGGRHTKEIADVLRPLLVNDLSDTWEAAYELARQHSVQHGHCNAATEELWPNGSLGGFALGRWIAGQRDYKRKGRLSHERTRRLEAIGIDWSPTDSKWHYICDGLIRWMVENNNTSVPVGSTHADVPVKDLGQWASIQRGHRRAGRLSQDKVEKLTNAGFAWDPLNDAFEKGLREAEAWAMTHGHCNAPQRHVTSTGYPLGAWIASLRLSYAKGILPAERQQRVESLGILWHFRDAKWEEGFNAVKAWADLHGHCNPPVGTLCESTDGSASINLRHWLGTQRKNHAAGLLDASKVRRLESIGMRWGSRSGRRTMHKLLDTPTGNDSVIPAAVGPLGHPPPTIWGGLLQRHMYSPGLFADARPDVSVGKRNRLSLMRKGFAESTE